MPWNGSGTYAPPPASFPEVTGTTIDAARFNATVNDLASGITAALAKNGENAATANLSMGGFKHTGAAAATTLGEYVTWNQTGVRFPGLGIGVSSSSWSSSTAVDLSPFAAVWGGADGANFGYNTYFDGTNHRAKTTAAAGIWNITTTGAAFLMAGSVAAGAVQTFVPRLVVQTDGVRIGATEPGTMYTLSVVGSGAFGSTTGAVLALANTSTGRGATFQCDDSQDLTIHNADNNSTGAIRLKTSTGTGTERVRIGNSGVIFTLLASPPTLPANSEMVFNLTSNTNLRISVRGTDGTTRVANITLA